MGWVKHKRDQLLKRFSWKEEMQDCNTSLCQVEIANWHSHLSFTEDIHCCLSTISQWIFSWTKMRKSSAQYCSMNTLSLIIDSLRNSAQNEWVLMPVPVLLFSNVKMPQPLSSIFHMLSLLGNWITALTQLSNIFLYVEFHQNFVTCYISIFRLLQFSGLNLDVKCLYSFR